MEVFKENRKEENKKKEELELESGNFLNYNEIILESNNGYLESKESFKSNSENNLIPSESILLLENLYMSILNNCDDKEILNKFTKIYDLYGTNQDVIFFAFWLPYIKLKGNIVREILNNNIIFCYNNEIKITYPIAYSSLLLNTYAFQLALANNLNDSLINFILDQGKIQIPIEWVLEMIIMKKLETVERALKGGNDCAISSITLVNLISECLESNENFKGIIQNKVHKPKHSDFFSKAYTKYFFNYKKQQFLNLKHVTESDDIKGNEITNFLIKRTGHLTITKILIFASLINYYFKEIIDYNKNVKIEEFDIENLLKSICLFDRVEKKFSTQILEGLYLIKHKKIARELLEAKLLSVNLNVLKTSIEYKDLKFALQFSKLYPDYDFYEDENFHNFLIENIYNDYDNIEVYLHFLKNFINSNLVKFNSVKFFLKIIENILHVNGKDCDFFCNFYNPVKIFILFADVLQTLYSKFYLLDFNISRLKNKCIEYSENILNSIDDYKAFREIILEKSLANKTLLEIISDNNFITLLKFKLVEKTVDDLWQGPYTTEGSFLETSYNYKALIKSAYTKDYDIYTQIRTSLSNDKEEKYESNFTHFKVWRENVYIKYYTEILITLILLGLYVSLSLIIIGKYQYVINRDVDQIETLVNEIDNFLYGENSVTSNFNLGNGTSTFNSFRNPDYYELIKTCNPQFLRNATMIEILHEALDVYLDIFNDKVYFTYNWCLYLIHQFRFVYIIPLPYIMRLIFQFKFKKPEFGLTMMSDIILVSWQLFVAFFIDDKNLNLMNEISKNLNYEKVKCYEFLPSFKNNLAMIKGDPQWQDLLSLSLLCSCLWFRIILLLRGTKRIGTIIVIFFLALNGIKYYLALFISVTFAYANVAILNFYNVKGIYFKQFLLSFYYFAISSVGSNPMYDDFINDKSQPESPPQSYVDWFGAILLFVVTVFNSIIMFNIIISYLTNIFEKYHANSIKLFIQKKLEIRRKFYTEDKRFDSLLVGIYPFEFFTFLPSLLFLFIKSEKITNALNKFILWIHFSFFAFMYSICYLFLTALLVPVSYVKIVFSKFLQICINDEQTYLKKYKFVSFIGYLALGLFIHIYHFFINFFTFLKELKKENIPLVSDKENCGKFKIKIYILKLILSINLYLEDGVEYKIHIEKFLEIFLLALENEDKIISEQIIGLFSTYNQEKEGPCLINQDFNIYNNKYQNGIKMNDIDYEDLCEFLSNFWDDKNVINLTVMKTVLNIYWKSYKIKRFYKKVSDKNYHIESSLLSSSRSIINISENQAQRKSYKSVTSLDVHLTIEDTSQINNKTSAPLKSLLSNYVVDFTLLKKASDYFIDSEANKTHLNVENLDKLRRKSSLVEKLQTTRGSSIVKIKFTKIKLHKYSEEFCIIPIIQRNIIYSFLGRLKEYQLDSVTDVVIKNIKNSHEQGYTKRYDSNSGFSNKLNTIEKIQMKRKLLTNTFIRKSKRIKSVPNKRKENSKLFELNNDTVENSVKSTRRLNEGRNNIYRKYKEKKHKSNIMFDQKEFAIPEIRINSPCSSNSSNETSRTDLLKLSTFKEMTNNKLLNQIEMIKIEENFEDVKKRVMNLEKNIEDILSCVKLLLNDKMKND